jgi:hypothetical protein
MDIPLSPLVFLYLVKPRAVRMFGGPFCLKERGTTLYIEPKSPFEDTLASPYWLFARPFDIYDTTYLVDIRQSTKRKRKEEKGHKTPVSASCNVELDSIAFGFRIHTVVTGIANPDRISRGLSACHRTGLFVDAQ